MYQKINCCKITSDHMPCDMGEKYRLEYKFYKIVCAARYISYDFKNYITKSIM